MTSTRDAFRISLILAIASVGSATNAKWVNANATHFCSEAEQCIKSTTEEDMQPDIINFKLSYVMRMQCCVDHTKFCTSVNKVHENATVLMRRDEDQFCRMIRDCYHANIIHSSTIALHQFCPYSNFCKRNRSDRVNNPKLETSCCMSCSCEESCGKENNCCYKQNATYNAIAIEELQCIKSDLFRGRSFGLLMRDKCKNETKCRLPNGQIVPATSQIKRRIYISKECGECNEANDVHSWQVMTSCVDDKSARMYMAGNSNADCETKLYPPSLNVNEWIGNFICPDEVVSQCDPDYKHEAVIDQCHNVDAKVRIESTVRDIFYANIYCVACNFAINYYPTKACAVLFQSFESDQRGPANAKLNMLLDTTTLEAHQQRIKELSSQENSCGPHTVRHIDLNQPGCRPVLCPSGMVRTNDGSCKYVAKLWFNVVSMIELSLRPLDGMAIAVKFLRNMTGATSVSPWLVSPCLTSTDIDFDLCLHVNNQSQEEVVGELAIRVYSKQEKTTPVEYLSRFENCLSSSWKLDLDGSPFYFKASFLRSKLLGPPAIAFLPDYHGISVYNECEYIVKGEIPFNTVLEQKINTHIKQLHYCDQVELRSNEIELSEYNIRLVHNNLTLGENFFDISSSANGYVVLVCKEDYLHGALLPTDKASSRTVGAAMCLLIVSLICCSL